MQLEVRCFAGLMPKKPLHGQLDMPDGATVSQVMVVLGLAEEDVKLVIINGVHADFGRTLHDRDRLAFVPAVGGG